MQTRNSVTEQLTRAGQKIEHDSFAIVDKEAGTHDYNDAEWQIVRRMIHATADFEFNGLTQFHPDAVAAGLSAIKNGANIIADVEMICVGLSKPRLSHFGVKTYHFIADEDVIAAARAENTTRAVQAMRKAQSKGLLENSIVAVGNAPTALLEVNRMVRQQQLKPALIVGMPVGFVSAAESKADSAQLNEVPWIVTDGRKGGSTLVVAAIHALLALAEQAQKHAR
ncbi:precorrin-8X methylmutase [methane-oxidizing endosymbiont of Gigantopelta aegis]|uniref:precorrin-8X methylmutase n=1 Tax=methane-oxidizing endosymbiont of Gigantopelta aegis TaxID=2794938 RepID=UPI0018DB60CD|nr:precorrin-8X methylmutase [methane-oxidizing endosymbiont of Gigantopelta aegis]